LLSRQLLSFAVIGVLSTVAYMALFLALRGRLGSQFANVISLFVCAVGNTAANRRHTFGIHALRHPLRTHTEGIVVFLIGLGLTSATLTLVQTALPDSGAHVELVAVTIANLMATASRFVLFRSWVFKPDRH
jgi:putative flippase GtrA